MAAYCQIYGVIHFTSPAGWLPVHRDQLRAQHSVTSMGKLYLFYSHESVVFFPASCIFSRPFHPDWTACFNCLPAANCRSWYTAVGGFNSRRLSIVSRATSSHARGIERRKHVIDVLIVLMPSSSSNSARSCRWCFHVVDVMNDIINDSGE